MSGALPFVKLAVHVVSSVGVSKIVNDVIQNNVAVVTTADAVKVIAGSIVIGSMVAEKASNHVNDRMDAIAAWNENRRRPTNLSLSNYELRTLTRSLAFPFSRLRKYMDPSEFPPNSGASRQSVPDGKNLAPVVQGKASRRRKSLRKQFSDTFVAGDARTAVRYVIFDVLLPEAKDMVVEAGSQGIEKLIFGDSRRRGSTPPYSGPTGHISYNRYSSSNRPSGPPAGNKSSGQVSS